MSDTKWTQFWDMHSGGGCKEDPYDKIYIEAPEEEAKVIFYNRFGHNPERVTCTCCGSDYSISEEESLEVATAYHRNCAYAYFHKKTGKRFEGKSYYDRPDNWTKWDGRYIEESRNDGYSSPYMTVEEYAKLPSVLIIRKEDIAQEERVGEVPDQGYVWVD